MENRNVAIAITVITAPLLWLPGPVLVRMGRDWSFRPAHRYHGQRHGIDGNNVYTTRA